MLRDLVRDFVTKSLGGSLEPFVAYLAEEARLTDEERKNLEERIKLLQDETDPTPQSLRKHAQEDRK